MDILLGLGGNLGDPPAAFAKALQKLVKQHRLVAVSQLYRTDPEGPPQPRFFNQVVRLTLGTTMLELLDLCQELEAAAGRVRDPEHRWGPRPLDIDLLLAKHAVHAGPRLSLPHPALYRRAFVLVPAAEIAGGWVHPLLHRTLASLAREMRAVDPAALEPVS